LIDRTGPEALARGILELRGNPELRERIARQGHRRYLEGNSPAAIGARAVAILRELAAQKREEAS